MKLIVNADDFGVSHAVNQAVVKAYQQGVLTSCSLMVAGNAAGEAVELAHANPGLGVGLHLVAVDGRASLPPRQIPHLVNAEGYFSNRPETAGCRYFFPGDARRELRQEIAAQFEGFRSTGLPLSHVDGHQHLHVHPVIFKEACLQAEKLGCRRMRVPVEELGLAWHYEQRHVVKKAVFRWVFGVLGMSMKRQLARQGFVFPDRVYGNLHTGRMSKEYFHFLVEHLHAPVSEIYCHPACFEIGQKLTEAQLQMQREYEALLSGEIKQLLQSRGVSLVNYFGLPAAGSN